MLKRLVHDGENGPEMDSLQFQKGYCLAAQWIQTSEARVTPCGRIQGVMFLSATVTFGSAAYRKRPTAAHRSGRFCKSPNKMLNCGN